MRHHVVPPPMRAGLAAGAGVLALSIAGCSPAPNDSARAGRDLCQVSAVVKRLVVQRIDPNDPSRTFTFPARVQVTKPDVARRIAADVCALPAVPSGVVYHCPPGADITYDLQFSTVDGDVISIEAAPTSCQYVWGHGFVTRRTALSPDFWPELGNAMGVHRPSLQTFVGTLPQTSAPPPTS